MGESEKSIAIIGAGIAGLSAGCYARMNGYRTHVFEMARTPGGLCTSWKRDGYTIDGSLNYLIGTDPSSSCYRMWRELGAIQNRRLVFYDLFTRIEGRDDKAFDVHTDLDRLGAHMKELAPEDAALTDAFIKGTRACLPFDVPVGKAPEVMGLIEKVRLIAKMFPMMKRRGTSLQQFADRYRDPFMREALGLTRIINSTRVPLLFRQMSLAWMHRRFAGYPEGGSGAFSRAIEQRFRNLGGEISYEARVAEILVENSRAIGLKLEDGSEIRTDYVISAADGRSTIFRMLKGAYVDRKIRRLYESSDTAPSVVQVALGVARRFDDLPASMAGILIPMPDPVELADRHHNHLGVCIYNFAPEHAPDGRTVIKAIFHSDFGYWESLALDRTSYDAKKTEIAEKVVAMLDKRFPGLAAQVEMTDVATPLTFERYTGNWRGSPLGWDLTTRNFLNLMKKQLPGLKNFYMAGQWVEPGGGVPIVAMSGRNVIQQICHQDRQAFRTTEAE